MKDPILEAHLKWISHIQPEGLVVSAHTLTEAGVAPETDTIPLQRRLQEHLEPVVGDPDSLCLSDLRAFLTGFLKWPEAALVVGEDVPDELKVSLDAFGDALEPSLALKTLKGEPSWLLLVREELAGCDFDRIGTAPGWQASPHARLERLLRETQVPLGILVSPEQLRLVYAPRGENAGHLTFRFQDLAKVAGRPMLAALSMLLGAFPLFSSPPKQRLHALLKASRESQARVSAELSQQVLGSLYELLRGFAEADRQQQRQLLSDLVQTRPQTVYQGLLSVLMRLVFLLYAEDRGLMPQSELYQQNYSVHGLWSRLRDEAARYPDTMDQRFGAWARLVALFRMVYSGSKHTDLRLPPRLGHLFDPARFDFLEGPEGSVPLVPDGTLYRVLESLLVLGGEKLSYRTLDVEQIGSVYESIMGFTLMQVEGLSLALKPAKKHGAPPILDLDALLAMKPAKRDEFLKEATDRKLPAKVVAELKAAHSVDDLLGLFADLQDVRATPHPVPAGGWVLAPTEERRKSGSHYTPRSLTEPVVRKALEPVWLRLGENPVPERILDLKLCDPAMGSGAFLVELCRQVAERLVDAWKAHGLTPEIPPDEDELLHARRIVAQRCLYGVDRNPMAVDLAKLSLWLATLAKDHPFTFLDHSLRAGDSLVGLSRAQAVAFHWDAEADPAFGSYELDERLAQAQSYRLRILQGDDFLSPLQKTEQLRRSESELKVARDAADLTLSAFFAESKPKARETLRKDVRETWGLVRSQPILQQEIMERVGSLRLGEHPIAPFHWELEFPEVFFPNMGLKDKTRVGFDAFVGNPPFAGKNTIASGNHPQYLDWLKALHEGAHGNADLSAHFFRRCFELVREGGSFGLIATNSIAQGDTRSTGLRHIRCNGGRIYNAFRRIKWPGEAAVVVSVVNVFKGEELPTDLPVLLDGKEVSKITAFLFHDGGDDNPKTLSRNAGKSFIGSYVLGMGFTFDDTNPEATSLAEMCRLIEADPRNQERIFPYIGGEEVNDSPTHAHHRFVINFGEMPLCRQSQTARWAPEGGTGVVAEDYAGPVAADWPDLLAIVEAKVKPERLAQKDAGAKEKWWQFIRTRGELYRAMEGKERVLAIARVSATGAFALLSAGVVLNEKIVVFPHAGITGISSMQSRIHDIWARTFSSTLKDDLQYTPSECFETFPFPKGWETNAELERVGQEYHDFRAALMVRHDEGLTKTCNRFHDPEHDGTGIETVDPAQVRADIEELRRLHSQLDRVVLAAYGWTDLDPTCEFLLDYEDDEEEAPKKGKGRKKPWRLRFPDPVRDEILARLLKLNAQYAQEEGMSLAAKATAARPAKDEAPKRSRKPKAANEAQGSLL